MAFFDYFRRRQQQRECITITDDAISRIRPDGVEETVQWDDLQEVGVVTTDEGPWRDDVFWLLVGSNDKSGCAVPMNAEGTDLLLDQLQRLPGFNNGELINALGSTSNARFTCWKRTVS